MEAVLTENPPRLEIAKPTAHTVELPGASDKESFRVMGYYEDLVIVGTEHAWRFAWRKDQLVRVASATLSKRRPAWTHTRKLTHWTVAFDELRQLVRFEDTLPGIERFFGENEVKVRTNHKVTSPMSGVELLAKWRREGFPLARGTLKGGGSSRCNWLVENVVAPPTVAARDLAGPRLGGACFDKDLHLVSVEITVP